MANNRAMGWRPGKMAERRSSLKAALKRRTPRGDRFYKASMVLDQGASPLSAAFAIWHWLVIHDRSFVGIAPEALAELAGKREAQTIEALIEMLQRQGIIGAAYWTRQVDQLHAALLQGFGPILVGSAWLAGMEQPDREGFIEASGRRIGRHCYLIVGYDQARRAFRLLNSWGAAWGQLGRAWIRPADLQLLLDQGEACVPVMGREDSERARRLSLLLQDRR